MGGPLKSLGLKVHCNSINSLCITEQKLFWARKDSFLGKIYFLSNTSLWAASKLIKNYDKPDLPWRIWGRRCKNGTFQYFCGSRALESKMTLLKGVWNVILHTCRISKSKPVEFGVSAQPPTCLLTLGCPLSYLNLTPWNKAYPLIWTEYLD